MKENIPTILVVDDEKSNLDIVLGLFKPFASKFNIVAALFGDKALKIVEKRKIDLVLLDIMMPVMDGYEVCKILKSQEHTKHIPVLFITANMDEKSIIKAYNVGGVDYITKPFRPIELLARVKTHINLNKTAEKLEYLASYDSMTGMYNRKKFLETSREKFKKDNDISAAMFSIDNLEEINDKHEHSFGDKLIKLLSKIISNVIPTDFITGRTDGNKFVILGQVPTVDAIKEIVKKIKNDKEIVQAKYEKAIFKKNQGTDHSLEEVEYKKETFKKNEEADKYLEVEETETIVVDVSISSYTSILEENDTVDTFLLKANKALNQAKTADGNEVPVAT